MSTNTEQPPFPASRRLLPVSFTHVTMHPNHFIQSIQPAIIFNTKHVAMLRNWNKLPTSCFRHDNNQAKDRDSFLTWELSLRRKSIPSKCGVIPVTTKKIFMDFDKIAFWNTSPISKVPPKISLLYEQNCRRGSSSKSVPPRPAARDFSLTHYFWKWIFKVSTDGIFLWEILEI